ncbi:MAG TPA: autotransporter domain-containing protein [Xanthobacteraceae bacterium]
MKKLLFARVALAAPIGKGLATIAIGAAAALLLVASPAWAACVPNGPAVPNGATVTCTGSDTTGVGNGTQNNVTVNVLQGASITVGNLGQDIVLLNANTITNNGTLNGGLGSTGINTFAGNVITNTGTISTGAASIGIRSGGNNTTVINSGTIIAGDSSNGIQQFGSSNTTNSGSITVGNGSFGIFSFDNSTIVNSGAITAGDGSNGITANANNQITNSGTITVGASSMAFTGVGINAPTNNIITNTGTIIANGAGNFLSTGIRVLSGNTVTNSGKIMGSAANGIDASGGTNNTIVNTGTIALSNFTQVTVSTGIAAGTNDTVTNSGVITVLGTSYGVVLASSGTLNNSGTIVTGAFGTSIADFNSNATVTNTGTMDGRIIMSGSGNVFTNAGLITITNGGTPIGPSYTIFGAFAQTAAGTLALRVNNAAAIDQLGVIGTVSLGGTLGAVVQPGLYGKSTTYVAAVGASNPITTTFDRAQAFAAGTTTTLAFFTVTPTYNATAVDITLNRVGFGAAPGETANESAVGNALEQVYTTSLTGNAVTFFTNLLQTSSVKVLDQLSGEGTAGTQNTAFLAGSLFVNTLMDQAMAWRSGERAGAVASGASLGYAAEPRGAGAFASVLKAPVYMPTWHAWGAGFGGTQSLKGDATLGSADFSDRLAGGALGFDYEANPNLLVGLSVGGSHSSFNVDARATSGTLDGGHVGIYGMQRFGSAYLSALVSYSRFENSTTRTIIGIGPTETATGAFSSGQVGGRLELGNTYAFNGIGVTPFVAAQLSQLWQSGYTESSVTAAGAPGMLGLTYQPPSVWSLPAFLGAQVDAHMTFANGVAWSPYARASWVHEFNPTRQVSAFISALPAATFTVDGARAASNSAKVDLGSRLAVTRNIALTASFSGEFSERGQTYAGTGAFRFSW